MGGLEQREVIRSNVCFTKIVLVQVMTSTEAEPGQ